MAELLEAAVSRGVMAAAAEAAAAAQQDGALGAELSLAPAPVLPPPMITDNYEANATSCHLQVCAVRGWRHLQPSRACIALIDSAASAAVNALPPTPSPSPPPPYPQEDFKSVFTDTQHGFTYEPRAPAEATFIAQK